MSALPSVRSFIEYEPLLWRVLSKLVRDGYHIQPHDARDLIHDFFLEWEPLNSRFDAAKGEFAALPCHRLLSLWPSPAFKTASVALARCRYRRMPRPGRGRSFAA